MTHFYREPEPPSNVGKVCSLPRISGGALSPFGKALRRLRFENGKRIFDLACDLEVSSSSVSAWETGRREVPAKEIDKIGELFNLDKLELERLRQAAELSKNRIVIEPKSPEARELANLIKQKINELNSVTIEAISRHLKWTPEGRIRWDVKVPYKSVEEIEQLARRVRAIVGSESGESFDIAEFYDKHLDRIFFQLMEDAAFENTCFEIWPNEEMPPNTRGMTTMYPPHIVLSNSVYEDASKGGHGGRWIMAHELGHLFLLHGFGKEADFKDIFERGTEYLQPESQDTPNRRPLPFEPPPNLKKIPRSQSAEMQADDFAGELLMPRQACVHMLPHNITLRYNVSLLTAKYRLRFISRSKRTYH